jgi:hypothetical protein
VLVKVAVEAASAGDVATAGTPSNTTLGVKEQAALHGTTSNVHTPRTVEILIVGVLLVQTVLRTVPDVALMLKVHEGMGAAAGVGGLPVGVAVTAAVTAAVGVTAAAAVAAAGVGVGVSVVAPGARVGATAAAAAVEP